MPKSLWKVFASAELHADEAENRLKQQFLAQWVAKSQPYQTLHGDKRTTGTFLHLLNVLK